MVKITTGKRKEKRTKRVRKKIHGQSIRPRLSVFRSSCEIYAQIINDSKGHTLISFSSLNFRKDQKQKKTKVQVAEIVGEELAKKAKARKISKVVFDRGSYKYHGRVKALAEGARKGGLKF